MISGSVARIKLLTYQESGRHWELDKAHPVYKLLKRSPLPGLTARVFKQTLTFHAVLHGAGYAYISRDGNGVPVELWPLLPESVKPVREWAPNAGMKPKLWYITHVNGVPQRIPASDMLCIMGLSHDGWSPYSVFDKARDSIGLGLAQNKFTSKFFSSGAEPRVIIEVPVGTHWKDQAQQEFLRQWNAMHQGLDNSHKTAILTGGAKVSPFSINASDSELLLSRKFSVVEIANWFGVPPHKLGNADKVAYNSLEQENQSFMDDGLETWFQAWEEECELKLLTEEEKDTEDHKIEFYRKGLIRPTMQQRFAAYSVGINARVLNPNECRSEEGLPPYEGGDEYMVPLNVGNPGGDLNANPQGEVDPKLEDKMESEEEKEPNESPTDVRSIPVAVLKTHRDLLQDACYRAIRRLANQMRRAAEKPESYLKSLDGIRSENESVIFGIIRPAVLASDSIIGEKTDRTEALVENLFTVFHADLLKLSGECTSKDLAERTESYLSGYETHGPEALADLIIRKETTFEGVLI